MSNWHTSIWAEELRQLWNEYDPIHIYSFDENDAKWPQDEYDAYHGIILTHLNKDSSYNWIFKSVKQVVTVNIGMTWNEGLEQRTQKFVSKIIEWFETKKPELKK